MTDEQVTVDADDLLGAIIMANEIEDPASTERYSVERLSDALRDQAPMLWAAARDEVKAEMLELRAAAGL